MRLYKRNGVYHVTYQSTGGKQIRRSLKTRDRQIAEQQRAKLELEFHEARIFGKEPAHSFKELMVNYLEAKQSTRGFRRLQYACKPLVEYFGDSDVTQLNEIQVEQYVLWRSQSLSDGTIKREVGTLSAAFNHAIEKHNWRIENPCRKAERPKEPKGRVRYLTHAEAQRLLQAAESLVQVEGACEGTSRTLGPKAPRLTAKGACKPGWSTKVIIAMILGTLPKVGVTGWIEWRP